MNWAHFWKLILILTLVGYSLLVAIVTIGGVKNIIAMFRDLKSDSRQS